MNNIHGEYRPLSAWEYFGYTLLFNLPIIGFIFLIIFACDSSNINRRNFARSFFCIFVIIIIIVLILLALGIAIPTPTIPNNNYV
jgi:hypothetical protein